VRFQAGMAAEWSCWRNDEELAPQKLAVTHLCFMETAARIHER